MQIYYSWKGQSVNSLSSWWLQGKGEGLVSFIFLSWEFHADLGKGWASKAYWIVPQIEKTTDFRGKGTLKEQRCFGKTWEGHSMKRCSWSLSRGKKKHGSLKLPPGEHRESNQEELIEEAQSSASHWTHSPLTCPVQDWVQLWHSMAPYSVPWAPIHRGTKSPTKAKCRETGGAELDLAGSACPGQMTPCQVQHKSPGKCQTLSHSSRNPHQDSAIEERNREHSQKI